jgi:hypothetical protein
MVGGWVDERLAGEGAGDEGALIQGAQLRLPSGRVDDPVLVLIREVRGGAGNCESPSACVSARGCGVEGLQATGLQATAGRLQGGAALQEAGTSRGVERRTAVWGRRVEDRR